MTDRDHALALLRRALGQASATFRAGQWEAIDAVVNQRRRLLVVERTGWGKSSVYFIATRILRDRGAGPTLIVSPLLALMRNQIEAARRLGLRAVSINSTNNDEWPALTASILGGEADAVLISPERLANERFVDEVLMPVAARIGLLVVDEAHCISDWGHDFRPDYQRLVNVLRAMPRNLPVLGTTATANQRVVADICSQISDLSVQRGSLMRDTLALQTLRLPDQAARLAWLAEHVPKLPGTGIVYALTKRDAEQVAGWLRQNGIEASAYYSGIEAEGFEDSDAVRKHLETQLLENRLKVLVATTALGMGYDKPDLGFVLHYQAPGSIIAYYQQAGRAGRAIDRAVVVLLSGREDAEIQDYFRESAFPDEEHVAQILDALASADGLSTRDLEGRVNLRSGQIDKALKYLSVDNPAPVLRNKSTWVRTPVAWEMDHAKIARLTAQREVEWGEVQEYVDCQDCLMVYLARKLDDEAARPCGRCARCLGRPVVPETFAHRLAVEASLFLRQAEFPLVGKKQVSPGAFRAYPFLKGNLAANLRAEEGRILARWGDAGWGRAVAEDKAAGRFRDDLVTAVAEMVRLRWRPAPAPAWVTCVPSLRHPGLVPDFAARLAERLGLPFVAAVQKTGDNPPQREQQNRFHQCRNLDGAFAVSRAPAGPVLLVDDVMDSGWTLTVVAALLRRAGASAVLPVALASAGVGD